MKINDAINIAKGMIHLNPSGKIGETIILAGFPRGGTTWLAEILNYQNNYRYLFEPFFEKYVPQVKGFPVRKYIRPSAKMSGLNLSVIDRIMSGKIRNFWIDRFNRKIIYDKLLIKDIRIHLSLYWLIERYPHIKIVFLLRHPFALVSSYRRIGWSTGVKSYTWQKDLVSDYISSFVPDLLKDITGFEEHIFQWCVENYVPLMQFRNHPSFYVCFYEWFCVNVLEETKKMFSWLGKKEIQISESKLRKPSKMSKKHSTVFTGEDLVRHWTKDISRKDVNRGLEILKCFKLDKLYDQNPFPKVTTPFYNFF